MEEQNIIAQSINDGIASGGGPCRDTWHGWLWYCDAHDNHGNADEQGEAAACAAAHMAWVGDGECDIHIVAVGLGDE